MYGMLWVWSVKQAILKEDLLFTLKVPVGAVKAMLFKSYQNLSQKAPVAILRLN